MRNLNFDSSRWKLLNNVLVGLVSVVGITFHNYKVTDTSIFQRMMIETMAPIQRGSTSLKEKVNYTFEHYINIINTSKENETLRKTIDKLNNNIFVLNEAMDDTSIDIKMFKEVFNGTNWTATSIDDNTPIQIKNLILKKSRQLKVTAELS